MVMAFYADGAPVEEVRVTHPLAWSRTYTADAAGLVSTLAADRPFGPLRFGLPLRDLRHPGWQSECTNTSPAVLPGNETVALTVVEPFYCSCNHGNTGSLPGGLHGAPIGERKRRPAHGLGEVSLIT
jgi:hypothetical protein